MSSINKELVKQWVEALRSSKYKQGRQALRNRKDEFCCLGVLCDISKNTLNLDWELDSNDICESEIYIMEKNGGVLPDSVWEYLGKEIGYKANISTKNSKIPKSVTESFLLPLKDISLVTLNDHYKLSFEQIADIIEEEFLK